MALGQRGKSPGTKEALANGRKGAGRPKGALNKRTIELTELFEKLDYDPALAVVELLQKSKSLDDKSKAYIHLELMQYKYPKRKAIQHSLDEGANTEEQVFVAVWGAAPLNASS